MPPLMPEVEFWRVRMKVGHEFERSEAAWDRGEVGVWYGAWTADDWRRALAVDPDDPWPILRDLPHQRALDWGYDVDLSAVRRFEAIAPRDWCVVYLRSKGEIGLARIEPGMRSEEDHPLNQHYDEGLVEVFKYRRIVERKSFRIAELPDAYRLLAAQGRAGTVHRFHAMREHVRLLAGQPDAAGVRRALSSMSFADLIDTLGASAWESVCTAYLTLEHAFVPTGLRTGSTLETLDIVGRSVPDGTHILAQCKKNGHSVAIDPDFLSAVEAQGAACRAFYFAFGGCHGDVPAHVTVIGRTEILRWIDTETGGMYRGFLVA